MALNRLDILVTERGARLVRRNIAGIGTGARQAQGSVQLLRRALGAIVAGSALERLRGLADSFTLIQNRIAIVTDGTAQQTVVTEKLLDVANRTRSEFQLTAEVYARTALATRELGRSQQETIDFTETLNKAVILSGAGVLEARNAMIQLSQGLSSNTLRGDELRAVLEQLPVVADVIAQHLGITRGELREMGEQNRITADIVLDAFKEMREEIEGRFAKTVPTIAQSFVIMRNQFIRLIGDFNQSTGVLQSVASGIKYIANNLEILVRAAGAAAVAISVVLVGKALVGLVRFVGAISLALFTNPFTAMAVAAAATIGYLVAFGDQLQLVGTQATVLDFMAVLFSDLLDVARIALNAIIELFAGVQGAMDGLDFLTVVRGVAFAGDAIIGTWTALKRAAVAIWDDLPAVVGGAFIEALDFVADRTVDLVNLMVDAMNFAFGTELPRIVEADFPNPFKRALENVGQAAADGFAEGFEQGLIRNKLESIVSRAEERALERRAREQERQAALERANRELSLGGTPRLKGPRQSKEFKEILRELEQEAVLLKLTNQEREVRERLFEFEDELRRANIDLSAQGNKGLLDELDALVRRNQLLSDQADVLDELQGPMEAYKRTLLALQTLQGQGALSQEEFIRRLRDARIELLENSRDDFAGYERGFQKVLQSMSDFATQTEGVITSAFNALSDAIVDFVKTGELSFRSLVETILDQLTRLLLNQLLLSILNIATGGTAGAAAGAVSLAAARTGADFVVGGSGGEDSKVVAFRATPGERVQVSTPRQQSAGETGAPVGTQVSGGGDGGQPSINLQNVNVFDPAAMLDVLDTTSGERRVLNVIERNPGAVKRLLSR